MKTVVYTMAATVLLLISLSNLKCNCKTVPCESVPFVQSTETHTEKTTDESKPDEAASLIMHNFSGKSMNFFIVSF